MANDQKSEGNNGKEVCEIDSKLEGAIDSKDYIQSFYLLILRDLTDLEKNDKFFKDNPQLHSTKKYSEDDDVISYFDKYFKDLAKNGYFDYLEYYPKRPGDLFVNNDIKKALEKFNYSLSIPCKDLAEKMGYNYDLHTLPKEEELDDEEIQDNKKEELDDEEIQDNKGEKIKKETKNRKNKPKKRKPKKLGFFIPFSDFKRKIKIYSIIRFFKDDVDFSKGNLDFRVNSHIFLQENEEQFSKLQNEKCRLEEVLNSEDIEEELKKSLSENNNLKRKNRKLTEQNDDLNGRNINLELQISKKNDDLNRSKRSIKRLEEENKGLREEIKKCQKQYEESELKNQNLNAKYAIILKRVEQKLKEKNSSVDYLTRRIKKQNSEFKKFKANYGVVIYNIWRMGRTLEKKSYKQYERVLILLEKSGIKIEEYDDIKDENKLSSDVTILDAIESSEVQETIVETIKPSIYYGEERIFEGEVIITKPK